MPELPTGVDPNSIIVESQGGIGNQLFIYAYARELQVKTGIPVLIDVWRHHLPRARPFQLSGIINGRLVVANSASRIPGVVGRGLNQVRHWKGGSPLSWTPRDTVLNEKTLNFDPKMLVGHPGLRLRGYFQSWRYFESVSDQLRAELTLQRKILFDREGFRLPISGIALHVRLGDYLHRRQRKVHGTVTAEYYEEALRIQLRNLDEPDIAIFSDEPHAAFEIIRSIRPNARLRIFQTTGSDLNDLLMMSSFQRITCANSSFSWWAAWLSRLQGESVCVPANWINRPDLSTSDLFPGGWTVLS